jgi:DNA repair protein RecN (Recombination protein N)
VPAADVTVSRELVSTGRSQARINGVAASASQLRVLAGSIVDVVGQHDAQRLLAPAFALETIERLGGAGSVEVARDVRRLDHDLQTVREQLGTLRADDGRALAQLEFARFAAAEIDAAAPEAGEDERLRERRDVLANAERILTALGSARAGLEDSNVRRRGSLPGRCRRNAAQRRARWSRASPKNSPRRRCRPRGSRWCSNRSTARVPAVPNAPNCTWRRIPGEPAHPIA